MRRPPEPSGISEVPTARIVLFVAVSTLLVVVAVIFNRGAGGTLTEREVSEEPPRAGRAQKLTAQLVRTEAEAEATARRFLTAFLRYEVGELTPAVRRMLLTTATPEFGDQLLASPTRRPAAGSFPPRAELRRVDVTFVSPQATLAVVDGTALRAGLPEEFGFVFSLGSSGWLASGAAE
jgi:hypothetical protein